MPYVAPEVLRGKPYTQAADTYSFGMVMYFVATGKQPFADRTHDQYLALDIPLLIHKLFIHLDYLILTQQVLNAKIDWDAS